MPSSLPTRNTLAARCIDSEIGSLLLAVTEVGVAKIAFQESATRPVEEQLHDDFGALASDALGASNACLEECAREIHAWLAGQLHEFSVPIDWCLARGEYRRTVQQALCSIPRGEAWSYRELAEATGRPRAARAVGTACATNPVPLLAPCHRVIRSDGTIGPYGVQLGLSRGSEIKRWLLAREGVKL